MSDEKLTLSQLLEHAETENSDNKPPSFSVVIREGIW